MNRAALIERLHADLRQLENGHDPIGTPEHVPGVPGALYALNFGVTVVLLEMASRGAYHVAVEAIAWATIVVDLIYAGGEIVAELRERRARWEAVDWRRALIEQAIEPRIVPVRTGNQTGAVELDPEPATFTIGHITGGDGQPIVFSAEPLRAILERDGYTFTRDDWPIANEAYTDLLATLRARGLVHRVGGRHALTYAGQAWAEDLLR